LHSYISTVLPVHTTYPSVAPDSAFAYILSRVLTDTNKWEPNTKYPIIIEADQSSHKPSELHTECYRKSSHANRLNHIISSQFLQAPARCPARGLGTPDGQGPTTTWSVLATGSSLSFWSRFVLKGVQEN